MRLKQEQRPWTSAGADERAEPRGLGGRRQPVAFRAQREEMSLGAEPESSPAKTRHENVTESATGFREFLAIGIEALFRRVDKLLLEAGRPYGFAAEEFVATCLVGSVLGGLIGLFYSFTLQSLWLVPPLAFAGLLLPVLLLYDAAVKRITEIRRALPTMLELLGLAVEAGMDFTAAVGWVVQKAKKNALIREFSVMLRELQVGKTREAAILDLDRRLAIEEFNPVANVIIRTDKLGTDMAPMLQLHADVIRTQRFQEAEKKALEAPVKMIFPIALFIFPSIFIVIFGPTLLQIFGPGGM